MGNDKSSKTPQVFLGVDVGGTKMLASVVEITGRILGSKKTETPMTGGADATINALQGVIDQALEGCGLQADDVAGMGIAVPGVVDPGRGHVVVTPNMDLGGVTLGPRLKEKYGIPVALGNDCNLGTLGECWLGAGREAHSAVGILVGTGIGAGFVRAGKVWRGSRESASEIGHIIMQIDGPVCGCGNRGCLEALASRSAIERDLRAAIESGRESVVTELLEGNLDRMKSGVLRKALEREDPLVVEIVARAANVLGHACLTVRHLIDPEVIILGGGVIEACSAYFLPTVERIVSEDKLPGAREGGHVRLSALGDDAVVLGAVALAADRVGCNPFKARRPPTHAYPVLRWVEFGQVEAGKKTYREDFMVRVSGKASKRKKALAREVYGSSHKIGPAELTRLCRGGPEEVFIGTGANGAAELTEDGHDFLARRAIAVTVLPSPEAVEAYNKSTKRRAVLIHVTC